MTTKPCTLCGVQTTKSIRVNHKHVPYCAACKVSVRTCSAIHSHLYDIEPTNEKISYLLKELERISGHISYWHQKLSQLVIMWPDLDVSKPRLCVKCGHRNQNYPGVSRPHCRKCKAELPRVKATLRDRREYSVAYHLLRRLEYDAADLRKKLRMSGYDEKSWMEEELGHNTLTSDTEWVRKYLESD